MINKYKGPEKKKVLSSSAFFGYLCVHVHVLIFINLCAHISGTHASNNGVNGNKYVTACCSWLFDNATYRQGLKIKILEQKNNFTENCQKLLLVHFFAHKCIIKNQEDFITKNKHKYAMILFLLFQGLIAEHIFLGNQPITVE